MNPGSNVRVASWAPCDNLEYNGSRRCRLSISLLLVGEAVGGGGDADHRQWLRYGFGDQGA